MVTNGRIINIINVGAGGVMSDNNFKSLFHRLQMSIDASNDILSELNQYHDKYAAWFPSYIYYDMCNRRIQEYNELEEKYNKLKENYIKVLFLLQNGIYR